MGIQPFGEFQEGDDGLQLAIFLPYMEPFLYISWLFPLNLNAYRMLEQIPFFFEEDNLIVQTLFSVTSSSFILSLILDPLPAIHYLEVGTDTRIEGVNANVQGRTDDKMHGHWTMDTGSLLILASSHSYMHT